MKCPNPDCKGELERVPIKVDDNPGEEQETIRILTPEGYFVEVTCQDDRRRYDLLECPDCGLTILQRKR